MAESTESEPTMHPVVNEQVYRLSAIDQSLLRAYIRFCLCYPCSKSEADAVLAILASSCQRLVTHLPILAGSVKPVSNEGSAQTGRVEVVVALEDVHNFAAKARMFKFEELPLDYRNLSKHGMPPSAFVNDDLTPLPDLPDPSGSPTFAIQANFITGGVLVALYLHHSVADIHGLGQIMRVMSSRLPVNKLTDEELRADAAAQSTFRDQLYGSTGSAASLADHPEYGNDLAGEAIEGLQLADNERGRCNIFAFNLAIIEETQDLIKERLQNIYGDCSVTISALDCLTAILWKAISRACWPDARDGDEYARKHHLTIPISIRKRITNPALPNEYFGNAIMHAETSSTVLELSKPAELGPLSHAARLIRKGIDRVTESVTREKIASINRLPDVSKAAISNKQFDRNLVITCWADLPLADADLGLGLGKPDWGRKLGRGHSAYGCIVLPVLRERGVWEVMVTLTERVMERVKKDGGLMKFVRYVV